MVLIAVAHVCLYCTNKCTLVRALVCLERSWHAWYALCVSRKVSEVVTGCAGAVGKRCRILARSRVGTPTTGRQALESTRRARQASTDISKRSDGTLHARPVAALGLENPPTTLATGRGRIASGLVSRNAFTFVRPNKT